EIRKRRTDAARTGVGSGRQPIAAPPVRRGHRIGDAAGMDARAVHPPRALREARTPRRDAADRSGAFPRMTRSVFVVLGLMLAPAAIAGQQDASARMHLLRGIEHERQRNLDAAADEYRAALERAPGLAEAHDR